MSSDSTHPHDLFRRYAITRHVALSTGEAPVPYHVYDGSGLLIGGTVAALTARTLIQTENLHLITTTDDKAFMLIWVMDFTEASLGPHTELQLSFLVTHTPTAPIKPHPLAALAQFTQNPDHRMLCHGIWNNTAPAVAYNRELLGLSARPGQSEIIREPGRKRFAFHEANGELIVQGQMTEKASTPIGVGFSLASLIGWGGVRKRRRDSMIQTQVVNRIGDVMPYNADAQAYTDAQSIVLQQFDSTNDHITWGDTIYAELKFAPQFIEHLNGVRFVYLNPHN